MRILMALALAACTVVGACSRQPEYRQYELQGQILAVDPAERRVVIKHGDIKGFMPGMTMPFNVNDAALLDGRQAGDLVTATLSVGDNEAFISSITKTGTAPLEEQIQVTATEGAILMPGDVVPDQLVVNQAGTAMPLSSLRGHRVALTFMYVRCPLPDFCPLMDRNFAAVQKAIKSTPSLADVRLVSVSFDPGYDTPAVLAEHAKKLGADPQIWQFVTATPEEMEKLTRRFGVHVERNAESAIEITHNLRTAVIDPEGRIVKVHSGTDWTPAQLVADLTAVPAPAR
jgi:protein SCO1/2